MPKRQLTLSWARTKVPSTELTDQRPNEIQQTEQSTVNPVSDPSSFILSSSASTEINTISSCLPPFPTSDPIHFDIESIKKVTSGSTSQLLNIESSVFSEIQPSLPSVLTCDPKNVDSSDFSPQDVVTETQNRNIPIDLNNEQCTQPHLLSYPKRSFGNRKRCFDSSWFKQRTWLEYSVQLDTCFCFPCRIFDGLQKSPFVKGGFSNWKHALEKGKGFDKHRETAQHKKFMTNWEERKKRELTGNTISSSWTKTTSDQLIWLEAVYLVTKYLASNGQPFRGDNECYDVKEGLSGGLFLNTFSDLLFHFKPELKDIALRLPKNSKYVSKDIQNETISVLADLVHQKVASEVKASRFFTIMVDGTTDKSFNEMQGLIVRYFSAEEGCVLEKALNIGPSGRSANDIFEFVCKSFKKYGMNFDGLVSQAYDGASVMSGNRKGLQALMTNYCVRLVIYIHCFAHKLNLVIKNVIGNILDLKDFFETVSSIYSFFKLSNVREEYGGTSLKRLIETRWSGHLESAKAVKENFVEIKTTLKASITNKKLDSGQRALAVGLLSQMDKHEFICLSYYVPQILKTLDILNKILQSSRESLISTLNFVESTRDELRILRSEICLAKIKEDINKFCEDNGIKGVFSGKRKTSLPDHFSDYILTDIIPSEKAANITQIICEFLDNLEEDFESRFSKDSHEVWQAMDALVLGNVKFLDPLAMKPLFNYMKTLPICIKDETAKLSFDDLRAECQIFKRVLSSMEPNIFLNDRSEVDIIKIANYLLKNHRKAAPILCNVYLISGTAGYASARVECLFSSLAFVDTPQRRSMTSEREADLTYLLFERKTLQIIPFDNFLYEWKKKPRKVEF